VGDNEARRIAYRVDGTSEKKLLRRGARGFAYSGKGGAKTHEPELPDKGESEGIRPQQSWKHFFELADAAGVPEDFQADRDDAPPQERGLL
jgi:hypothetical protein